jgi:hypothetical protein
MLSPVRAAPSDAVPPAALRQVSTGWIAHDRGEVGSPNLVGAHCSLLSEGGLTGCPNIIAEPHAVVRTTTLRMPLPRDLTAVAVRAERQRDQVKARCSVPEKQRLPDTIWDAGRQRW